MQGKKCRKCLLGAVVIAKQPSPLPRGACRSRHRHVVHACRFASRRTVMDLRWCSLGRRSRLDTLQGTVATFNQMGPRLRRQPRAHRSLHPHGQRTPSSRSVDIAAKGPFYESDTLWHCIGGPWRNPSSATSRTTSSCDIGMPILHEA